MKRILLTALLLSSIFSYSQDIIHKKDGSNIEAKIITFGTNTITYKIWKYQKAPSQKISTSEVKYVGYQNGTIKSTAWFVNRQGISKGSFTDPRDSIKYKTITFAGRTWMAENLRSTKTTQGKDITWVVSDNNWVNNTGLGYCYYNNDPDLGQTYGCLYNWETAKTVCPSGWHLPTDHEWTQLENSLIENGFSYDSLGKGKGVAKSLACDKGWIISNTPGAVGNYDFRVLRNKTGFSALPSGGRDRNGKFSHLGDTDGWWSATEYDSSHAYIRSLFNHSARVYHFYDYKSLGLSVRCVKDKD